MARKKKTFEEALQELDQNLQESHQRWISLLNGSCADPFWPDGVNMNLVRNHIIYYQFQCEQLIPFNKGFLYPLSYFFPVPVKVSDDLVINTERKLFRLPQEGFSYVIPEVLYENVCGEGV